MIQPVASSYSKTAVLWIWRVYLIVAILQGISALVLLGGAKSGVDVDFWLGLSRTRLVIVLGVGLILLALGWLLIETWFSPSRSQKHIDRMAGWLSRPAVWGMTVVVSALIFLAGSYFITLAPEVSEPFSQAYFDRLLPLVIWATGLGAQTLVLLFVLRYGPELIQRRPRSRAFYLTLIIVASALLVWAWIARAILPYESRITGWNRLGVPIIETQVLIAWAFGMAILGLTALSASKPDRATWLQRIEPRRLDLLLGFFFWLAAVILWSSIAVPQSWFVSEPLPPNAEYYPTSDARFYDTVAQSALVGEGYWFQDSLYIRRPFHALYLTVLHVLGGQNYKTVAYLQIFVLAWIPVIIFFLAKALHNRVSGVIAAVLIILREANSISISGNITASHVKLLMVDLFSALAVLIFVYLTIVWLQAIEQRTLYALVCGGLVGLSMLIRLENFVFLFPLAAITGILLGARKRYKLWVKQMALVLWGVLLVISPWVWRNWQLTGLVFIDSPIWRYGLLAQRYSPKASSTPELTRLPAESPGASTPQAASPVVTPPGSPAPTLVPATPVPGEQIVPRAEEALDFIMKNPGRVALLWVTHFLNSQIQTMLILPTTSRSIDSFIRFMGHRSPERFWYECCSVLNYVRRMPYWHRWDGRFPSQAIVPLIINTVIFAIGIHETWKKRKIVGITPLIFGITYLVFNSLFRNSGGRYILPVDWNSVLYFSIGLGGLSIGIIGYLTQRQVLVDPPFQLNPEEHPTRQKSLFRSPQFYAITAGFFLLGCLIPLVERGFPQIYTEPRKDKMLSALFASELIPESQRLDIQTFLSNGGAVAAGRALYPVFLPPDTPVTQITNSPLEPKPYSRIDFFLVGPDRLSDLILPLAEKPALFPNASDVLVFHCPDREVLAVAIFDSSASPEAVLMRSPLPGVLSCPLPPG